MTVSAGKRLTIAIGAALLVVVTGLLVQSWRTAYERSLAAQHPVAPQQRGNDASEWLFVGDSRVSQWAQHDTLGASYLGFPGASTWQIAMFFAEPQLQAVRGKRVVLQFGINDLRLLGLRPQSKSALVQATADNLWQLAERMSLLASDVTLLGVIPPAHPGLLRRFVWSSAVEEAVTEVNASLRDRYESAGGSGRVRFTDFTAELTLLRDSGYADTLHLNSLGYRRLNALLNEELAVVI